MRAAVTGGTGFVGGHLVAALRARGDEVRCLVRATAAEAAIVALGARAVPGALGDASALDRLLEGADVVYHVAGRVSASSEDEFLRTNRDGAAAVAAAARRAGVRRLVLVSSLAVTGPTVPGRPLDESAPPRPVTPYGRSKAAGEEAVRRAGVPFTVVRPPIVFGPRDREVLRLFRAARWRILPVLGDGRQEYSFVYGPDLAEALVAAGTSERTLGGTYHAGHPDLLTVREWMHAVAAAVGVRARVISVPEGVVRPCLRLSRAMAGLRGRSTVLDPSKAEEILAPAWTCTSAALERDTGWRPRRPLPDAFAETARWYREAGWL